MTHNTDLQGFARSARTLRGRMFARSAQKGVDVVSRFCADTHSLWGMGDVRAVENQALIGELFCEENKATPPALNMWYFSNAA